MNLGLFEMNPGEAPMSQIGIDVRIMGNPPRGAAITVQHGRWQHFALENDPSLFPAAQLQAQNPRAFITSKGSPVLYYTGRIYQAVNVADPTFETFFQQNYVNVRIPQNGWMSFDNGGFEYSQYGALVGGVWNQPVIWDQPFPQNESQYEQMITSGLLQLRRVLNPDKRFLVNFGTVASFQGLVPQWYSILDGALSEDFQPQGGTSFVRQQWGNGLWSFAWMSSHDKTVVLRQVLRNTPSDQTMVRALVCYLLASGDHTYWCPSSNDILYAPAKYVAVSQALGSPSGPYTFTASTAQPAGYGIYSRSFSGGSVVLNMSGKPISQGGQQIPDMQAGILS